MKKIFLLTVLCLAITASNKSFAYDMAPANTPEMQRIQQSSFERFAPQKIKESYDRKEAAQQSDNQSEQQIQQRIEQIEQAGLYRGQVENKQIYVSVQKVVFPQSMVFTEAELQEFVSPLIGKTVTIEEINKVIEDRFKFEI